MADDATEIPMQDVQVIVEQSTTRSSTIIPGPRASALQRLYSDATTHVLKTCSYKSFASCFPTPAATRSETLKDLHKQFTTDLGRQMKLNFDVILDDSGVVQRLNELDGLIEDAKRRRTEATTVPHDGGIRTPIPPHTLPARELYLAHLAPSLSQMSTTLKNEQAALANENIELLQQVMLQRQQIKELVGGLEDAVTDLQQASSMLSAEDVDTLRDIVRSADEEMRAAS